MSSTTYTISIPALEKSIPTASGTVLMDALTAANIQLRSDCGGGGGCGKCKVEILGEDDSVKLVAACIYKVEENVAIRIPEGAKLSFHIIKKAPLELPVSFYKKNINIETDRHGLAVDLGTTTLAMYLCELQSQKVLSSLSIKNPQALYGDDVMSRIEATGKGPRQLRQLQRCVVHGLEQGMRQLLGHCKLQGEDLTRMVVVGNPTMIHLLLGESPRSIGLSPYQPGFSEARRTKASTLGLHFPGLMVQTLPQPSGFIGGDILAATLATELSEESPGTLLVDLGTNGELMLKGEKGFYATSCATGPAFEGATLSCGMQAVPGAIDKVEIHGEEKTARYTRIEGVNGEEVPAAGLCGSGIISAVSEMLRTKVIDVKGVLHSDYTRMVASENGSMGKEYVVAGETDVAISQKDIRSVQLGKAALITGIEFLQRAAGLEKIEKIIIAGTFGSYLDKSDRLALGMLPKVDLQSIEVSGNAAGAGAIMILCDDGYLQEAEKITGELTVIDLATNKDFQQTFVEQLYF